MAFVVEGLSCVRGERVLFQEVSFSVPSGGILHIQGPNGVGKTSLLMRLAGLLKKGQGSVSLKGQDLMPSLFYWQGTQKAMKEDLSVQDNLSLWAELEGVSSSKLLALMDFFKVGSLASELFKNMSQGQRQRMALMRLGLKEKPLWLLDEPLTYLDQENVSFIKTFFQAHQKQGGIICLTSHTSLPFKACQILVLSPYGTSQRRGPC